VIGERPITLHAANLDSFFHRRGLFVRVRARYLEAVDGGGGADHARTSMATPYFNPG
jgi:hypothetical protein